jgi:hypothetical protein
MKIIKTATNVPSHCIFLCTTTFLEQSNAASFCTLTVTVCSKNVPTQASADNIQTNNQLGTDNLTVTPISIQTPNPLHKFCRNHQPAQQNYTGSRQTTSIANLERTEAGKRRLNNRTETGWPLLVGKGHGRQKQQVPSPGSSGPRKQPSRDPISRPPVPLACSQQQEKNFPSSWTLPPFAACSEERPRKETPWPLPPIARNLRWLRRKSIPYLIYFSSLRSRI